MRILILVHVNPKFSSLENYVALSPENSRVRWDRVRFSYIAYSLDDSHVLLKMPGLHKGLKKSSKSVYCRTVLAFTSGSLPPPPPQKNNTQAGFGV